MGNPVRDARDELKRAGLLAEDPSSALVPEVVARSWRRSISSNVASEGPAQHFRDIDSESILCRAADPILDRWQHQLADTGTTLFLSDRAGSIVARRASDPAAQRRLDRANAVEGFDYSEEGVGTNGLGTAIVESRPVLIEGAHHFNDLLTDITCAAVPVATPAGPVIGAISLGGLTKVTNPLMMSVTREIGQQIEERIKAASRPQDLALAMSFMRYANARRPTVVLDQESLMANTPGLPYVCVDSHVMLWERLTEHRWVEGRALHLELAEESVAVTARRVVEGPHVHYVAHFTDLDSSADVAAPQLAEGPSSPISDSVEDAVVIIAGPAGSGRSTIARELCPDAGGVVEISSPGVTWRELQAALDEGKDVLLRRGEALTDREAGWLATILRDHRATARAGGSHARVFLTVDPERCSPALRDAVDVAGHVERTAPLAETPERIPGLVAAILEQVDEDRHHSLSPTAMQALVAWRWPGNIAELDDVVTHAVSGVTKSLIERDDLPEHLRHVAARRRLSPLEGAERETIIRTLAEVEGNRSKAAARLGIGRTTLYRRLRQLGINGDDASL